MENNLNFLIECIQQEAIMIESFDRGKDLKFKSFCSFLLEYGLPYPKKIKRTFRGQARQCFRNCTKGVLKYENLIYCEGYAINQIFPHQTHHAWLVNESGEVIDPTWDNKDGDQNAYFGIAFSLDFVCNILGQTKHYGVLTNERVLRNFLKDGLPENSYLSKVELPENKYSLNTNLI